MAHFESLPARITGADIARLAPLVAKWEGGYVNDPDDRGGPTNMGITLATWKAQGYDKDGDGDIDVEDMRLLDIGDFELVLRKYWDRWRADEINNQQVANLVVDWLWCSGSWGIIIPQRVLGVKADGIVGPVTIGALNAAFPPVLHTTIWKERYDFLQGIVRRSPKQRKFLRGWLNRLDDFKWQPERA